MYPELKSRREFVHNCWVIAKATENEELKISLSKDPFFYQTREDLLELLTTLDDKMITHLIEINVKLLI